MEHGVTKYIGWHLFHVSIYVLKLDTALYLLTREVKFIKVDKAIYDDIL